MLDTPAAGGRVHLVTIMMLIVAVMTTIDVVILLLREHRVRPYSAALLVLFILIAIVAQRSPR